MAYNDREERIAMKTNTKISKCDCCGRRFSDGDGIFERTELIDGFRYEHRLRCRNCERVMTRPEYVFSGGEAVLILYGIPQRNLSSGSYVLEETCEKLTVHERRSPFVFGQMLALEYRPHHQYLLLLPEKLQFPCSKRDSIIKQEKIYSVLNTKAKYVIIDNDRNICGFASTDTLFSEWRKKEKMTRSGLRCISRTELNVHCDTSDFALACRSAIETVDPVDLLAYCEHRIQGQGRSCGKQFS